MHFNNNNNRRRFPKKNNNEYHSEGLKVTVRDGEDVNRAIRRLKKKVEAAGLMQELRDRQFYVKPSEQRRKDKKAGRMRWLRKQKELNEKLY
jgi:small subunit ribosomal protein S21